MGVEVRTTYQVTCDICRKPIGSEYTTIDAAVDNAGRLGEQIYDPRWHNRPMIWRCMNCKAVAEIKKRFRQ